ncbi:carbohydrate ABC transporter permease [Lacrimispora sp.]|uniref:carbohydrate ABC transporter permease n=1 Tax=Lacrimispora sp. TaxID=2719234 RepID=UPI0028B17A4C|nr:sugar ABC transporter permease [Lacrimispora sp.]
MSKALRPKNIVIYGLLAPGLAVFVLCCIAPLFVAVYNSFFDWDGGPVKRFVGFQNYVELVQDRAFWSAFKNNLTFIFWTVLGQIGIAFLIAMLLQSRILKFKNFHRTVIFFPVVLSAVVVGFLWRIMYNSEYGIVNTLMRAAGLGNFIQLWLDDPDIVIGSLAIPKVWQFVGYYLIILLAAIQGIDQSVLEVAELDGATGWKKSRYIVVPLIKNTLMVTIMLCISGNMKTFDQIFVMTGGGPGTSSEVVALYAYNVSMNRMRYGYGSTAAIGILILSLGLIMLSRLAGRKKEES